MGPLRTMPGDPFADATRIRDRPYREHRWMEAPAVKRGRLDTLCFTLGGKVPSEDCTYVLLATTSWVTIDRGALDDEQYAQALHLGADTGWPGVLDDWGGKLLRAPTMVAQVGCDVDAFDGLHESFRHHEDADIAGHLAYRDCRFRYLKGSAGCGETGTSTGPCDIGLLHRQRHVRTSTADLSSTHR